MAITIRDVAKLAGSSVAATSATLNGTRSNIRVGAQTRERIVGAAAKLGYVSNPIAKSLATGKTRTLGLLLPYAEAFTDRNPFCSVMLGAVMEEVVRRHYNLMLFTAFDSKEDTRSIDSRIDGLVTVMPDEEKNIDAHCLAKRIPVVSILQAPSATRWTVNCDDFEGGRLAADHLIGLGYRSLCVLAGDDRIVTSQPRVLGFLERSLESALTPNVISSGFYLQAGYESAMSVLTGPDRPEAIFAANDCCAEGVLRAASELELAVPKDLAVVGFDDTWFTSMTSPPLTSVRMPMERMAQTAVDQLIARIEGDDSPWRETRLGVSLTVRASCGPRGPHPVPKASPSTLIGLQRGIHP